MTKRKPHKELNAESSTPKESTIPGRLKMLWVEDDPITLSEHSNFLERHGYEIHVSENIEHAMKFAKTEQYDICLFDMLLDSPKKGPSPIDLVKDLHGKRIPIVVLTNTNEVDKAVIESGADVFMRKPCPPERLHDVIETLRIRRDLQLQRKPVFVAHEFSASQRDDLRAALDSAFKGTPLTLYYADADIRSGHILLGKIIERIKTTEFGIYDVSAQGRPNVFLELGIAIGTGRPYYIIAREGTEFPADLAGLDRIEYRSFQDLISQVKDKIISKYV